MQQGERRSEREAARNRPVILAVTSELPWPLNTGGHLRTFHLMRVLSREFDVRLVTAAPPGSDSTVAALAEQGICVCPAPVPPRLRWREGLRAAGAALLREPYVFYHRHNRHSVRALVRREFDSRPPDLLYLDHLDSLLFAPLCPRVPALVDLHNVYSTLARRAAAEQPDPLRRAYLRREADLLERVEARAARHARALFTVSREEADWFRQRGGRSVFVIPNGVDCNAYAELPTKRAPGKPVILYVGTMSWSPNVAAAEFLATQVLPHLRERLPDATLRIVGRDPTAAVTALARLPGVEVTGGVPDVRPHLAAAHVLAVPLAAGGGTRLKILEAFAAGLPVVSTAIGCEGIPAAEGEHLVIAERDRFAAAIERLLRDPASCTAMAERARQFARRQFDWSSIGQAACQVIHGVLAPGDGQRPIDRAAGPRALAGFHVSG